MTEDKEGKSKEPTISEQQERLRQDFLEGKIGEDELASKTNNLANKSHESWKKNIKKKK